MLQFLRGRRNSANASRRLFGATAINDRDAVRVSAELAAIAAHR